MEVCLEEGFSGKNVLELDSSCRSGAASLTSLLCDGSDTDIHWPVPSVTSPFKAPRWQTFSSCEWGHLTRRPLCCRAVQSLWGRRDRFLVSRGSTRQALAEERAGRGVAVCVLSRCRSVCRFLPWSLGPLRPIGAPGWHLGRRESCWLPDALHLPVSCEPER